jgi:acyl-CoA reductase-like NAD-dependent aldehyde dehydrogenase
MGTVISSRQLERMEEMVKKTGGQLLAGGSRLTGHSELDNFDFSKGSFFPPTVVAEIPLEDELWREEVFGPVVVVKRFSVSRLLFGWVRQGHRLSISAFLRLRAKAYS